MKFYSEILGLNLTNTFPGAYFFAADGYHHHVATNTWLGRGVAAASPKGVGLNHFGIELPSREEFEKALGHFAQHKVQLSEQGIRLASFHDSDGIEIRLYYI